MVSVILIIVAALIAYSLGLSYGVMLLVTFFIWIILELIWLAISSRMEKGKWKKTSAKINPEDNSDLLVHKKFHSEFTSIVKNNKKFTGVSVAFSGEGGTIRSIRMTGTITKQVFSDITSPHVVRPVILVPKDAEVFISYENKPIKIFTPTKERPSIGMTAAEVKKSSWGYPEKINTTETEYGTREQWVYSDNRYVYLEDGIVTAIQDSK